MIGYTVSKMKRLTLVIVAIVSALSIISPAAVSAEPLPVHFPENDVLHYDPNAEAVTCGTNGILIGNQGDGSTAANLQEFIDIYGQFAFDTGKQYGIPYEAILAQAALESSLGKSRLTTEANNFFGIKAGTSWTGPVWTGNTQEEGAGGNYTVKAAFRAYPNPEEGFRGYGEFIRSLDRYSGALQYPQDPFRYIEEIKAAGYATDSAYVTKNHSIIRQIQAYIASKGTFPPSSEVTPDVAPPQGATTNTTVADCDSTGSGVTSGSIQQVIAIAEAELAKSPVEYDADVMKYTTGRREAWCADFATWVFNEAGIPFTGGNYGWQIPAVLSLQSWFQNGTNGSEYFRVGEKMPQPGDIAFYIGAQTPDGGSTRHANIVISVDEANMTMTTIGGNESNAVKKSTRKISPGSQSLVGFGRVNK